MAQAGSGFPASARVDGPGTALLFEQQHFVTKRVIFVWFAEGISIGIYNYNML